MEKLNGKVKSFNKSKGYGFIIDENGNEYFFHFSSLNMEGFKTVKRAFQWKNRCDHWQCIRSFWRKNGFSNRIGIL